MRMMRASLPILGILIVVACLSRVQAQDRSRSRYIPPADEESFAAEDDVVKTPRTSRRTQFATRTRHSTTPPEEDSRLSNTARSSNQRSASFDGHPDNTQTQFYSQPDSSYSQSVPYDRLNREEILETTTSLPSSGQRERRKRPKKRRRPKSELKAEEVKERSDSIREDTENLPNPVPIDIARDYTGFRNSKPAEQFENVPSRGSTSSRNAPSVNSRIRGESSTDSRNRNLPVADTRSRSQPSEVMKERAQKRDSTQENIDSRTSRRHSFHPQPAHNRLPIQNDETTRNLEHEDRKNKRPENIEQPTYSSEHLNINSPPGLYNPDYRPLDGPHESHSPYQPHPEDRLPGSDNLANPIESEIHMPPPGQPYDVSEFAQPGVDYSELPQEREIKLPLNPTGLNNVNVRNEPQNAKYPVPSNRLPDPVEVNYKPPESTDHSAYLHSSNAESSDLKDGQPVHEAPRGIVSDRLPGQHQRHSSSLQRDSRLSTLPQQRGGHDEDAPRRSATPQSRVGSRYQSDNQDDENMNLRRNVNPSRSGSAPDPRLQNVANRYLQSHRGINEGTIDDQPQLTRSRTEIPLQRAGSRYQADSLSVDQYGDINGRTNPSQPTRSRTEVPLQRGSSRYQPDGSDVDHYNPSRNAPSSPPPNTAAPIIESTYQRNVPRSQRTRSQINRYNTEPEGAPLDNTGRTAPERNTQRTRSRYTQAKPEVVVTEASLDGTMRRTPERGIQRTRSRYSQTENVVQPNSPQDSHLRSEIDPNSSPRTVPHRDRTRSRHQSTSQDQSYPVNAAPEVSNPPQEFHRSRPQFEDDTSRIPYQEEPEYLPEYQNPQRPPQRRPSQVVRQPQTAPRQRSTHRQQPSAPPQNRQSAGQPTSRSNKSQFECPDDYGFFPDEQQCDKYYECRNGTAEEGLCSDGLVFNLISSPTYLRCDSLRDVDCTSRPNLQEPRSTKHCPRRFGLFSHETDCTRFWQCVDGSSTEVKCPPGLVYDDSKGTCNWADLVKNTCATEDLLGFTCPEATAGELLDGVYSRYAHPENCQLHFTCIKGTDGTRRPRMLSCNEGLVFDPATSQCTRPEHVPGCEEFYGKPVRKPTRQQTPEPPLEDQPPPTPRASSRRRRPSQQRNRT